MSKDICDKKDNTPCPTEFINGFETLESGVCYTLYQCNTCGILAKYDVWDNAGTTFLKNDNTIINIPNLNNTL